MTPRIVLSATLAVALAFSGGVTSAFAQSAPAASPTSATKPSSEIKAHIDHLRAELKITSAQRPEWDALASVMRQNATEMETLYRQRSQNAATMNAVEILKSYRQFTRTHLAGLKKLIPAFTKLYAVLSAQQKKTADTLFQNRAAAVAARKAQ